MRRLHYFLRGRLFPCALLFLLISAGIAALAIWLPRLLAPVAIFERAFSLSVAIAVIAADELNESKIAKLTLLFLPWIGAALCIFFRTPTHRSAPSARFEADEHEAFNFNGSDFGHGALTERVAALSKRLSGLPCAHADSVRYFFVGREMYEQMLRDLTAAKHRIFLEYYIIAQGVFWGDILAILTAKAKAGVDVRVIYDDFGCGFTLPEDYCNELKRRNIKAAIYRPVKVGRGFGRRDHRKLAVIDGVAYTGGINLADEYIGKLLRFGHWKDSAIRLEGDISAFLKLFLQTWYALNPSEKVSVGECTAPFRKEQSVHATGISAPLDHKLQGDAQASKVPYVPVADWAEAAQRTFPKLLLLVAAHARSRLWMFTPYLSLPREAEEALRAAALAGVDVRIMIPHVPDKKTVFFLTRAYARKLERAGVRVREYTPGFLHAKSFSVDGEYAFVSSYNLDFRSFFVQAECGVFFESTELAKALERDFESAWEQGMPVKRAGKFKEFISRACMLFAPMT